MDSFETCVYLPLQLFTFLTADIMASLALTIASSDPLAPFAITRFDRNRYKKSQQNEQSKRSTITPFIISSYFNILKVENTMTTKRVNEN